MTSFERKKMQTLNTSDDFLFDVRFCNNSDGYIARNLVDYLKNTNTKGCLIFRPDTITYTQDDAGHNVLNSIVVWTDKLSAPSSPQEGNNEANTIKNYYFNNSETRSVVGLNIADLRKFTRFINRKDGLRLYRKRHDPFLHIQPLIKAKDNKSIIESGSDDSLKLLEIEDIYEDVDTDNFARVEEDPNCEIPIDEFCKMSTKMNSLQCKYIIVKGYPKGVRFEGQASGIAGSSRNFGICDPSVTQVIKSKGKGPKLIVRQKDNVESESNTIKIKRDIFKALSKINNLDPEDGKVRVYLEDNVPMRIICKIGSFGKLTIYLQHYEPPAVSTSELSH